MHKSVYFLSSSDSNVYACEIWSTIQGDEEKLFTFTRKVLQKIHELIKNQNGEYEKRKIEEL